MPRSKRKHHEISSWWQPVVPPPAESEGAIANDSCEIHPLKEGENWLVFSNDKNAPKISVIHGPMLSADNVRNDDKMMEVNDAGRGGRGSNLPLSVLCIDVDNSTNCVAVKDVRDQSKVFETNDNQFKLEFFLARRKLGVKNSDRINQTHCNETNSEDPGENVPSDLSSRGYTSDDEKDDLEDDELKQKQTCDLVPEEKDADGNPLYEPHEILPSRQLRVLSDRDRIIMKYTHINSIAPRIAKFEYAYGRRKHVNPHHLANTVGLEKAEASVTGRPRLLSIKSDANLFKANDTSAAEAPSVDDISIKATVDNHKAGKDWSAVDDKKNASDDDAMEEYSYLTGEVVIRDQASMSAITGDEAMPASSKGKPGTSRGTLSPTCKKEKEVSFDKTLSPKETPEKKQCQEGFQFEIMEAKEVNNDLSEFLSCRSHEQDTPKRQKEKDHDESSTETEIDLLSQPSQTKPRSPKMLPKHIEEKSHNHSLSGLEGRSKGNCDDDDSTTCSETAKELPQFHVEASYANDDGDDISQTQPLPRHMMEQHSKADSDNDSNFSGIEEEEKQDDFPQKLPSQVEVQEADQSPEKQDLRFSQLTGTPKTEQGNPDNDASHGGSKCDDNLCGDEEYNAETQFEHELIDHSQSTSTDEAYNAETQFEHILPEADNTEANDNNVIDSSANPVEEETANDGSKSEQEFKSTQAVSTARSKNNEAKCNKTEPMLGIGKDENPKSQADSQNELLSQDVETQFVKPTESLVGLQGLAKVEELKDSVNEEMTEKTRARPGEIIDHQPLFENSKADKSEATAESTNIHDKTDQTDESIEPGGKTTNIRSKKNREKTRQPPIGIDAVADKHMPESNNNHGIGAKNSSSPRQQSALDSGGLLSDDAIHHINNGAMMTSSVGGANIGLDLVQGSARDLLTSIAMQSTNLPGIALLHNPSEETTVVNGKGAKQKDHLTGENINQTDENNNANKSDSSNTELIKSTGIPTEVFVKTPAKSTTSSDRLKRSRRSIGDNQQVRVMFTGVDVSARHRKMVHAIGAELVESLEKASSATHVIVSDGKSTIRRTPKLMICICKTSNVVTTDWLEKSASQQKILHPKDFLVLNDKVAEATYNFSMQETLENGKKARDNGGGVLAGFSFFICRKVADVKAPPMKALQLIIEAAGAKVIKSLSDAEDPLKTIILTSDPSTKAQLSERGVKGIADAGAKIRTTSWLFHTIFTQRYSDIGTTTTPAAKPKSASKRKRKAETPKLSAGKRRSLRH
eukprot:scaffold118490_cov73-Cyclotella_meneghiniana.AAC.4